MYFCYECDYSAEAAYLIKFHLMYLHQIFEEGRLGNATIRCLKNRNCIKRHNTYDASMRHRICEFPPIVDEANNEEIEVNHHVEEENILGDGGAQNFQEEGDILNDLEDENFPHVEQVEIDLEEEFLDVDSEENSSDDDDEPGNLIDVADYDIEIADFGDNVIPPNNPDREILHNIYDNMKNGAISFLKYLLTSRISVTLITGIFASVQGLMDVVRDQLLIYLENKVANFNQTPYPNLIRVFFQNFSR